MNEHLTEQQLIDYQFKLADEARRAEAGSHLEQCEPCRRRLETLARKFAALELLRDEVTVSESLLSRTVAKAVEARRRRLIWFYRVPALGAVAAAAVVGFALLLVSNPGQDKRFAPTTTSGPVSQNAPAGPADREYALSKDQTTTLVAKGAAEAESAAPSKPSSLQMSPGEAQPGAASETVGRVAIAPPAPTSAPGGGIKAEDRARRVPVRTYPQTLDSVTGNAPDAAIRMAQAPEIAEQPPFAPASAIELVVLPRRENVQLTIYNGADLTLVRERRNLTLKKGWNWLQFMWANTLIDPTSLSLEPLEHRNIVQVQQLVFPPRLRELGRWLIRSEVGGQVPFELTYFTSGLAWRAFYMGTLSQDEKMMHLEGYVRISNGSGEDYEDAQTRLVVGTVHLLDQIRALARRQDPYGSPSGARALGEIATELENAPRDDKDLSWFMADGKAVKGQVLQLLERKEIQKEGLSEYFLYTIEGTETIANQWGKRLISFEADGVPVTSLYKYDEERWGTETIRFLSFANDEKHKLGQTPLPDGTVRVYGRADEEGHLSYAGGMDVKYIPVGEEVELDLGAARLVEVKPILIDYRVENHLFDNQGNVSGWDEVRTWRIEVANTRPLPVEVEVTRGFETPYWTLRQQNQEVSYEKHDATHARFKLMVEPRSKRVFEYEVTTYHGNRQQAVAGK
jgi:hypothetical protein